MLQCYEVGSLEGTQVLPDFQPHVGADIGRSFDHASTHSREGVQDDSEHHHVSPDVLPPEAMAPAPISAAASPVQTGAQIIQEPCA